MTERDRMGWLHKVYGAEDEVELTRHYDAWAADYDEDLRGYGYRYPAMMAGMVGRYVAAGAAPLLDAGAGTGILGEVLAVMGYRDIVAIDMSEGMLAVARGKGVYARLERMVLGETLAFEDGSFAAALAMGVLTLGHAPPRSLDELVRVTRPGGHVVFTLTRPAYTEGGFKERQEALVDEGRWRPAEVSEAFLGLPAAPSEVAHMAQVFVYEVC